jgi:hypothetical protein
MPFRLAVVLDAMLGARRVYPVATPPVTVNFGARQLMLRLKRFWRRRLGRHLSMAEGFGREESSRGRILARMLVSP